VAEHLGFEQRLGEGGAVDRDQRFAGAAAVLVNELGDDFLAGAALSADKDGGIGGRDLAGQLDRLTEEGRDADQGDGVAVAMLLQHLLAELAGLPTHHDRVGSAADQDLEVGRAEGLGEIIPGSGAQRLDAGSDARVAGHHDDDGVLILLERGAQDLEAGHLRHVEIDEHDIELAALEELAGFFAPSGQRNGEAIHLKHAGAAFPQGPLIVDEQDPDVGFDFRRNRQRIPGSPRFRETGTTGGHRCGGTAHPRSCRGFLAIVRTPSCEFRARPCVQATDSRNVKR